MTNLPCVKGTGGLSRWIVGLAVLCHSPTGLEAQSTSRLAVQGTAAYNHYWHTTAVEGVNLSSGGQRFSGRVAVRVSRCIYIGIGVGSWHFEQGLEFGGVPRESQLTSLSTAVVSAVYVQVYPGEASPFFIRAGLGLGQTRSYLPDTFESIPTLRLDRATRVAPTLGIDADVDLASHLALTIATDATALIGVDGGRELKSAIAASIGLTVR